MDFLISDYSSGAVIVTCDGGGWRCNVVGGSVEKGVGVLRNACGLNGNFV